MWRVCLSQGFSLFIGLSWVLNLAISLTTLSLIDAFGGGSSMSQRKSGVSYLFWMFGVCSVVLLALCQKLVPCHNTGQAKLRRGSIPVPRDSSTVELSANPVRLGSMGHLDSTTAFAGDVGSDRRALLDEDFGAHQASPQP